MMTLDVAIAGAGPAGCGAAVQCSRLGLDAALLDMTGSAGGLVREARLLENYPGLPEPVSGEVLVRYLRRMIDDNGMAPIEFDLLKVSLEGDSGGSFRLEGREGVLRARAVILAVGTRPVDFNLKTTGQVTVHRSIIPLLRLRPARTLIVGGGEAALDYALNLAGHGTGVTVAVRGDGLKARGRLPAEAMGHPGIDIRYNTAPLSASGRDGGVIDVRLSTPEGVMSISTDAVLAAVGRKALLPSWERRPEWEPGSVRTDIHGVFVAGDASLGSLGQASIATGHGVQAATLACRYLEDGRR